MYIGRPVHVIKLLDAAGPHDIPGHDRLQPRRRSVYTSPWGECPLLPPTGSPGTTVARRPRPSVCCRAGCLWRWIRSWDTAQVVSGSLGRIGRPDCHRDRCRLGL